MISIDAYRARIGSFQSGKSKQKGSEPNIDDFFSMKKEKGFPRVFLTQKQSCFIFLCVLGLMSILCCDVKKDMNIEGTSMSITCNNGQVADVPSQETIFQTICHTDHTEIKTSYLTFAPVLAAKLLIGNIEANPGSVNLKEFLA